MSDFRKSVNPFFLFLFLLFCLVSCGRFDPPTKLLSGLTIKESTVLDADTFRLSANGEKAAIIIEGDNVTIDFNGAVLIGSKVGQLPNEYKGVGVSVKGKNVTVKNASVHGFQTAIRAVNSDSLKIMNCDLSHNYKYKEGDAERREGMAMKLGACNYAEISGVTISSCENGIYFGASKGGKFYNNKIQFNSGWGLMFFHGDSSELMYNSIDWNEKGLAVVSSDGNLIFKNSLTHNERLATCMGNQSGNSCVSNIFSENDYSYSFKGVEDSLNFYADFTFRKESPSFSGGMSTALDSNQLKGRKYILRNEWGVYDFNYPSIWLRNVVGNKYTFLLYGPPTGNYKIIDGEGWSKLNRVSGAFPATLIAEAKPDAKKLVLECEFIGQEFIDEFGRKNKKGKVYPFRFEKTKE